MSNFVKRFYFYKHFLFLFRCPQNFYFCKKRHFESVNADVGIRIDAVMPACDSSVIWKPWKPDMWLIRYGRVRKSSPDKFLSRAQLEIVSEWIYLVSNMKEIGVFGSRIFSSKTSSFNSSLSSLLRFYLISPIFCHMMPVLGGNSRVKLS